MRLAPSMPRVSRLSTWLAPITCMAAHTASRSPPGARLLGHVALADEAPGHELALLDGLPGLGDQPGEELQGADLEGDARCAVVERARRSSAAGAEDAAPVLGQRDEGPGVALLGEPLDAGEVRRALLAEALEAVLELAGLVGRAVDLLDPAVLVDDVEQALDERVVGTCQELVDGLDVGGLDAQSRAHVVTVSHRACSLRRPAALCRPAPADAGRGEADRRAGRRRRRRRRRGGRSARRPIPAVLAQRRVVRR